MGSFNATCIVSNLPIEAGTRVRYLALTQNATNEVNGHSCYVHGRWQLRCPPLRASYNDYGSIEHIKKRFVNRVFFESFDRDVVEKGVGENQCHDVQVRRGMKRKDWLEALCEGRVEVTDNPPSVKIEPSNPRKYDDTRPVGIPSMTRIEKVLTDAGLSVITEYRSDGYFIDEVSTGFIRIRHGKFTRGGPTPELDLLLPLLHAAGYNAMITAGTGRYSRDWAEVLVAPLPNEKAHFCTGLLSPEDHNKPRPVSLAMIREDVWRILLATTLTTWKGDSTFEKLRSDADEAVKEMLDHRAKTGAFHLLPKEERDATFNEFFKADFEFRNRSREGGSDNLFWNALRPGEGNYGFNLGSSLDYALDMNPTAEELASFIQDLSETVYVERVYAMLHGQWHPTTNSGQDGNWKEHRAFLRKLIKIRSKWED